MTGKPLRYLVIIIVVPCEVTANYHLVTIILLLEAAITAFIFSGFWTASVQSYVNFDFPSAAVSKPNVFAPIAGLGEQQIDSDCFMADREQ